MKLKDSELKSILAEVEGEIASLLKNEGQALKKAKDGDGDADDQPAEASASAPAEESAPAEGSAPPAAEASAPPEAPPAAPEASVAPEGSAPAGDPAAAAGDPAADVVADPEALKAEYSKLDPESLKAHYMACKAALFEAMGAAAGAGPEASATPPPAPAAPEASSTEMTPPPALKAEVPASIKNVPATADTDNVGKEGGKGAMKDVKPLGKSERDGEVEDLKAQVELLAKAMDLALGAPMRKAVTSTAELTGTAPAKEPSKADIKAKIRKAMESGKLTKSQRESIFSYTLGNTDFDQIKDLLG